MQPFRFSLPARIVGIFLVAWQVLCGGSLFAQNKDGFYDEYDMDLRNLPGGSMESEMDERFQIYNVPPPKVNNFPVTPKNVRRYYDPLASIPGASAMGAQGMGNQNAQRPASQSQASFVNPVTGEVDPAAYQNATQQRNREKERKEKEKKRFVEEKTYPESKARRFQIVFFLTMPFALGASAGFATLLGVERAVTGTLIMIVGTTGLSATNALRDIQNLDEHKKKHGTEWHKDDASYGDEDEHHAHSGH